MRSMLILLLAAGASCLPAQVKFAKEEISVIVDGKPFTTFHYGSLSGKPYLAPLRSASGKIVTRRFPMEQVAGESKDHLHHTGLWFSYDDVNGVKFWENDPSYTKGKVGRIVVRSAEWKDAGKTGTLNAIMDWVDPAGTKLLVENRDMTFYSDPKLRTIDFHITLTAAQDVTFGDTKEGAFAIRLADSFTEKKGLKITNAEGLSGMKSVWGKRSDWVDYSTELDGEKIGVAMFSHSQNPRHPTYWHARDYGLFSLNPFGRKGFDPKAEESLWKLPKGEKIVFQWRVVIHPGDMDASQMADLYKSYTTGK